MKSLKKIYKLARESKKDKRQRHNVIQDFVNNCQGYTGNACLRYGKTFSDNCKNGCACNIPTCEGYPITSEFVRDVLGDPTVVVPDSLDFGKYHTTVLQTLSNALEDHHARCCAAPGCTAIGDCFCECLKHVGTNSVRYCQLHNAWNRTESCTGRERCAHRACTRSVEFVDVQSENRHCDLHRAPAPSTDTREAVEHVLNLFRLYHCTRILFHQRYRHYYATASNSYIACLEFTDTVDTSRRIVVDTKICPGPVAMTHAELRKLVICDTFTYSDDPAFHVLVSYLFKHRRQHMLEMPVVDLTMLVDLQKTMATLPMPPTPCTKKESLVKSALLMWAVESTEESLERKIHTLRHIDTLFSDSYPDILRQCENIQKTLWKTDPCLYDDDSPEGSNPTAPTRKKEYETYVCTEYGRMMGTINEKEHGGPYISTELLDLLL